LRSLRLKKESFSEAIERLGSAKGNLKNCLGLWKLTATEQAVMEKAIAIGRRLTDEMLEKIHGKTT